MKEFYKKVITTLQSEAAINAFTAKSVPAIKQIDLYRGQYLYEDEFEQLLLPAVLVEYNINHQSNTATINIHCCWEQLYETDSKSADRDAALMFFDWQDVLYDLLYELESKNTGKLKLLTEGMQKDDSPTNVHVFSFECSYLGRVKKAADKYNTAELEALTASGTIKNKVEPPKYDFN